MKKFTYEKMMNSFSELVGKTIDTAIKKTSIEELYKSLAKAKTTREIFLSLYEYLVKTKQMEALENIPLKEKQLIWEKTIEATREMEVEYRSGMARTHLAKCIYLIQVARS